MNDLLKTSAVLVPIIILLRCKVSMSAVMPKGTLAPGITLLTPTLEFLKAAAVAVFAPKSLEMTLTLMLTMVMATMPPGRPGSCSCLLAQMWHNYAV